MGKIQSDCNPTRITGTLREEVFTFMTESDLIHLRMGNILDESCRENRNTHFMFNNFFSDKRAVSEIMSKNMVETEGPQMTSQYGAYTLHAG